MGDSTVIPSTTKIEPSQCFSSRSNTPESSVILATSTVNPNGRKRPSKDVLGGNPSQKQRKADARADYWSQRRWEEQQSRSPSSMRQDPRIMATARIEKNLETYEKLKDVRQKARDTYNKKNGKKAYKHSPTAAWFKDYIQRATRKIANAERNIARYAAQGTRPRSCDWEAKLESASNIKQNLIRRNLLHNVLNTMYKFCSEDLQQRLDEGYLEREIFRDFVLFSSKENMDLLRAALKVHHADFSYWNDVLKNEEAWNAEFGVDKNYRVPCVDFSKLKFGKLDFL